MKYFRHYTAIGLLMIVITHVNAQTPLAPPDQTPRHSLMPSDFSMPVLLEEKPDASAIEAARKRPAAREKARRKARPAASREDLLELAQQKEQIEVLAKRKKAAAQNDASAQFDLGWMYQQGRDVKQDDVEAVSWYQKAATQNNASAQLHLGWMYKNGRGVKQDYVEAVKWYQKAAAQNNASAQNNLGWMYHHGRGVTKDQTEAIKWLRKAAAQGDNTARENLKNMGVQP